MAANLNCEIAAAAFLRSKRSAFGAGRDDRRRKLGDMLSGYHRPNFEPMVRQYESHINLGSFGEHDLERTGARWTL
jgi:hypothetical protein